MYFYMQAGFLFKASSPIDRLRAVDDLLRDRTKEVLV
jgi:hypothetical protein